MKRLSTAASAIVASLIDKLQDREFYDVVIPDQPILNIKRFDTVVHPDGTGFFFSVGLFVDNSRLCYATRIVSLVIDKRVVQDKAAPVHVMPFYYQDDPNGILQKAAVYSNEELNLTDELQQRDICKFMERWVIDLQTDGYV